MQLFFLQVALGLQHIEINFPTSLEKWSKDFMVYSVFLQFFFFFEHLLWAQDLCWAQKTEQESLLCGADLLAGQEKTTQQFQSSE